MMPDVAKTWLLLAAGLSLLLSAAAVGGCAEFREMFNTKPYAQADWPDKASHERY